MKVVGMMEGSGRRTGAIAESSVSSRTFSMADLQGSMGGGFTRVEWSTMSAVNGRV